MIRINGKDVATTIDDFPTKPQGIQLLSDYPKLYEPQRSNNFDFVVTGLGAMLRAGALPTDSGAYLPEGEDIGSSQEVLRISVDSGFVPRFTQGVLEVKRGNDTIKYAGAAQFGEGSLVIKDFIGAAPKAVLEAWQNLSYNVRTGKVGHASDYKKDAYLIEYSPDYTQVCKYVLKGCWISGISEDPFAQSNNDVRLITATIQYDKGYPDYSDVTFR